MWQRNSFHDCAEELSVISADFRAARIGNPGIDEERRHQIMIDTSNRGVEILRALALAVRSQQDYGIIPTVATTVGAIKHTASETDVAFLLWAVPQVWRGPRAVGSWFSSRTTRRPGAP